MQTVSKVTSGLIFIKSFDVRKTTITFELPKTCEIYDNIFLTFDEFATCESIQLIACSVGGEVIQSISGRELCLHGMLNPNFNPKAIKIPFCKLIVCKWDALPQISITFGGILSKETNIKISKIYIDIISKFLPVIDLAKEVLEYIGYDNIHIGNMSIWTNSILMEQKNNDEYTTQQTPTMPVTCFKTANRQLIPLPSSNVKIPFPQNIIMAGNIKHTVNISKFHSLTKKLFFAFRKVHESNLEVLPILREVTLTINSAQYCNYSKKNAHQLDKLKFKDYVPEQEIYTITFEKKNENFNFQEINSYDNISCITENCKLSFIIEPQEFAVEITVHTESTNFLMHNAGRCVLRYTKLISNFGHNFGRNISDNVSNLTNVSCPLGQNCNCVGNVRFT
jgi:hypothetical protein